ncbi:capsular polysaccharide export protein, LipB/KpsS family [Flavobacterium aquicola]|uniref:Capsular polysaccharide biosynthesis protein n=1 Tax=Flavobacterium aquicola TaxID=1682742 RepID=A0A3E0EKJ7_9FLAO|nr:hypothetical protein [Flavobacterium aquicola]REG98263.1 capsular polysaccharide biosynthesis protein [Flavobacterium aquicola]
MRKYILVFGYTNFTKEETSYWNNLSIELMKEGYELFVMAHVKPQFQCHFFNYSFVEKLDDVDFGFFNGNVFSDDLYFEKYLQREKIWYGNSLNDRLTASKFQKYKYEILLNELNPALVVLGNGEHAGELILKDEVLKRKIPLIYFERGCLPKTWHVDIVGITAGTAIAKKEYAVINLGTNESYLKYKNHYLLQKYTWWQQPTNNVPVNIRKRFNICETTKIILFANQLDNDTSNFLYSPFFKSNLEAFIWFCSELGQIKGDVFVLIKKHPFFDGNEDEFQEAIESNNLKGKWVFDISIFDCLEQSDLFCTVNSTSIYEAMIYEKPVLQLGKSILSNKDIVYELQDLNRKEVMKHWISMDDFPNRLEKFEYFMAYMIDNELSFFADNLSDEKYNNHIFFMRKMLENVDLDRKGNYPHKFLEIKFKYEAIIVSNLKFKRLLDLKILIFKEITERISKKFFRFFYK